MIVIAYVYNNTSIISLEYKSQNLHKNKNNVNKQKIISLIKSYHWLKTPIIRLNVVVLPLYSNYTWSKTEPI